MKTGLNYEKLIEYFSAEALKESSIDDRYAAETPECTLVERITFKTNGEVQISTWEQLNDGVRGCERYTYRPDQQGLRHLTRVYGPLQPGTSKTVKKMLHDGKWVQI
jgi:hypothetical protein